MVSRPSARASVVRGRRSRLLAASLAAGFLYAAAARSAPGIVPPRRLDEAAVPYPPEGHGDATVELTIVVDARGAVTDVTVVRGDAPFCRAAAAAVKTWRFAPATRDDVPVAARITAAVDFHVEAAPAPVAPAPSSSTAPAHRPPALAPVGTPLPPRNELEETVSVRGERAELDTIHIPRREARFVPGTYGDPFHVVEALPGMAPWISGLPYYFVRGASPESVGYFIDGIRVPLLFHTGAGPSMIAPALVDSVDLYPGAYPARYGRYAGAIVAGETTPPVTDRTRGEASVRAFDAAAFVETPYDRGRGSALAAARIGYTNLVIKLVAPKYRVDYWDYQARVSHRAWGNDTVSVFAFGSHDELTYLGQRTFRVDYHRVDVRYDHPLDHGALRVAATVGVDDSFTALQVASGAGASASLRGPSGRLRAELDERVAPSTLVRAGADFAAARFDTDQYDGIVYAPHTDFEGGAWADAIWRPVRGLEIVPGLRFDAYRARNQTTVAPQPRLATQLRLSADLSWISALGVAHQEPTEEVFVPAKLPQSIDEASRDSYQASEAIDARLPSSMHARLTAFASRIVARHDAGEQRSEGVELFVQRDFTERLGGFVSYTLSRSDSIAGARTAQSLWDRTHLLSVVLGYDFGGGWRAGTRFFLESGRSFTLTCPTPSCAPNQPGPPVYSETRPLPPYFRIDARVERRWTFPGGHWLGLAVECFNTLGAAEPVGGSYSAAGVTVRNQSPLIFPSIDVEGGL
jgi:TonB family protein